MKELIEELKQSITNSYDYFLDEEHFEEVDDAVGFSEDSMRMYDVGYIRALEAVVRRLEELTVEDYD